MADLKYYDVILKPVITENSIFSLLLLLLLPIFYSSIQPLYTVYHILPHLQLLFTSHTSLYDLFTLCKAIFSPCPISKDNLSIKKSISLGVTI